MHLPKPLARLIKELNKLPTIGPKTAQRLAFYIVRSDYDKVKSLADALLEVKESIRYCSICGNITDDDPCALCSDPRRDKSTICVVHGAQDIIAMERTRELDRKSTRLNSSHVRISYAVFCLKKKKT